MPSQRAAQTLACTANNAPRVEPFMWQLFSHHGVSLKNLITDLSSRTKVSTSPCKHAARVSGICTTTGKAASIETCWKRVRQALETEEPESQAAQHNTANGPTPMRASEQDKPSKLVFPSDWEAHHGVVDIWRGSG